MHRRLNEKDLEQFVHQTLRSLPDRRAPASLEVRVRAEIARRAALPWWHKSYAYWPLWARVAFLAGVGGGTARLLASASVYLTAGFGSPPFGGAFKPWLALADRVFGVVTWIGNLVSLLAGSISPLWLYGGLAFVAVMYVSLFGLGAAAYRILWIHR
jgi:hypothetical protein